MSSVNGKPTNKIKFISDVKATSCFDGECGSVTIFGKIIPLPLCFLICVNNAINKIGDTDLDKCVGCGECTKVCPKGYIELEKYNGR